MPGKKELPRRCGGGNLREQSAATWFQKRLRAFSSRWSKATKCWQRMRKMRRYGVWESETLWRGSSRCACRATEGAADRIDRKVGGVAAIEIPTSLYVRIHQTLGNDDQDPENESSRTCSLDVSRKRRGFLGGLRSAAFLCNFDSDMRPDKTSTEITKRLPGLAA